MGAHIAARRAEPVIEMGDQPRPLSCEGGYRWTAATAGLDMAAVPAAIPRAATSIRKNDFMLLLLRLSASVRGLMSPAGTTLVPAMLVN